MTKPLFLPPATTPLDGERLVHLKGTNRSRFKQLVDYYRKQGIGDGEIVQAMADARGMISTGRWGGGRS